LSEEVVAVVAVADHHQLQGLTAAEEGAEAQMLRPLRVAGAQTLSPLEVAEAPKLPLSVVEVEVEGAAVERGHRPEVVVVVAGRQLMSAAMVVVVAVGQQPQLAPLLALAEGPAGRQ